MPQINGSAQWLAAGIDYVPTHAGLVRHDDVDDDTFPQLMWFMIPDDGGGPRCPRAWKAFVVTGKFPEDGSFVAVTTFPDGLHRVRRYEAGCAIDDATGERTPVAPEDCLGVVILVDEYRPSVKPIPRSKYPA